MKNSDFLKNGYRYELDIVKPMLILHFQLSNILSDCVYEFMSYYVSKHYLRCTIIFTSLSHTSFFNTIGKSFEILILVFPHCLEFGDIKGKEVSKVANIHWILFQKLGFYLFI